MDYRSEAPPVLRDFLTYHENIRGHSRSTVDEYFLDLRNFFRYLKLERGLVETETDFDKIPIRDIDLPFIAAITLSDVYDYLGYLSRERARQPNSRYTDYGLTPSARARKVACIRSFFKYLTVKAHLLTENPVQDLDSPRIQKSLPHYLTLDESIQLLSAVEGKHKQRDVCILMFFLNCGLRVSELVGLNLSDIRENTLRVLGKGNKERIVYFGPSCSEALEDYFPERAKLASPVEKALFLSAQRQRISVKTVQYLVKKHLGAAALDTSIYSTHKLRHTAATLMLQNGVNVRVVQEVLGHEHLNTTQIYTHVSDSNLEDAALANPLSRKI